MVTTRRSRIKLTDLPQEVIGCILAAAGPDEAAVAAGLSATCRWLRGVVLSSHTTEAKLRHFGRSRQIAPLLRRLTGLQKLTLASCGCDATLWLELQQLQQLQHLALPLALAASCMQPLSTLQRLTSLAFTGCEYSAAEEPLLLPAAAIAALSRLEALDASACAPLAAAVPSASFSHQASPGLQDLSTLQQLEVLHVPCGNLYAITRLAAHLPRLRSLDLRCCSAAEAHKEADGQLALGAATALTKLRLHVCAAAAETVRRLQMPPQLQVLDVTIMIDRADRADDIMAVINALPLQRLASLRVLCGQKWLRPAYSPPQVRLQLPRALPQLQHLHFGGYCDWDALHRALWPLSVLAAQHAFEQAANSVDTRCFDYTDQQLGSLSGDTWRLQIQVSEIVFTLTAADILQLNETRSTDSIHGGMRGRLKSASFSEHDTIRLLREGESEVDVVHRLLADEPQLTRLDLVSDKLPTEDSPAIYQQLGRMAGLQHLDAMVLNYPTAIDCRAVGRLQQLTTLAIPLDTKVGPCSAVTLGGVLAPQTCGFRGVLLSLLNILQRGQGPEIRLQTLRGALRACLRPLTHLRQLKAHLPLTPDTLATLQPLTALTQLHLSEGSSDSDSAVEQLNKSRNRHRRKTLQTLRLPLRQLILDHDEVGDDTLAAALEHMPCLQELHIRFDFSLFGDGLEVLPRCCPFLKVLRLQHVHVLTGCFLPALQHLEELTTFEVVASPLAEELPAAVAAQVPPNLLTLQLQYLPYGEDIPDDCQCAAGKHEGFGVCITEFLGSLPSLRAPLRSLSIQRGNKTPFQDADLQSLVAAAQQLAYLEKLALHQVQVTSGGLKQLLALPMLVELTAQPFQETDDDENEDGAVQDQGYGSWHSWQATLEELCASFKAAGRTLFIGSSYI